MSTATDAGREPAGLRLRQTLNTSFDHDDSLTAESDSPNSPQPSHDRDDATPKRTFGRTPDGKSAFLAQSSP